MTEFDETSRLRLVGSIKSVFKEFNIERAKVCLVQAEPQQITEFLLNFTEYKNITTMLKNFGSEIAKHTHLFTMTWLKEKKKKVELLFFLFLFYADFIIRSFSFRDLVFSDIQLLIKYVDRYLSDRSTELSIILSIVTDWERNWKTSNQYGFNLSFASRYIVSKYFPGTLTRNIRFKSVPVVSHSATTQDKLLLHIFWSQEHAKAIEAINYLNQIINIFNMDDTASEDDLDSDVEWSDEGTEVNIELELDNPKKILHTMRPNHKLSKNVRFQICENWLKYLITYSKPLIDSILKTDKLKSQLSMEEETKIRSLQFDISHILKQFSSKEKSISLRKRPTKTDH